MELKERELHIWRYILDENHYHAEKTSSLLSKEEHKRCDDYINESDKIRYTCNHRFVREVLAKYVDQAASEIKFGLAPMGKPFIKNSNLFFSYSYRTTICLLAISKEKNVGVDVEKMKTLQDVHTFASFSFSEHEKKIIFKSDAEKFDEKLFTFWTFKEAVIKALGVGLNADLTQIDLSEFLYRETNPIVFDNNTPYTVKQIGAPEGYKAAFAVKGEIDNLKDFNFVGN